MKIIVLITSLILCGLTWGQTTNINLKKHNLTAQEVDLAKDHNFGNIPEYKVRLAIYDTIKYYGDRCLILYPSNYSQGNKIDTLCDLYFMKNYEFSTEQIDAQIIGEQTMINFEKYERERKKHLKKTIKKNAFPWYYLLLILAFIPFFTRKKNEA